MVPLFHQPLDHFAASSNTMKRPLKSGCLIKGDEARTTLKGREVHKPLKYDHYAIAIADQEHEMHDQPHEPSQQTCEAPSPNCADSIEAPDHSKIPFINVMKGMRVLFSRHPISNHGGHIVSLLHRYLCHAWQWFAILARTRSIANHKNVGMPREGYVAADLHPACPIRLSAQPFSRRRCPDPCRPNNRFGGNPFSSNHRSLHIDRFDRGIPSYFAPQPVPAFVPFLR